MFNTRNASIPARRDSVGGPRILAVDQHRGSPDQRYEMGLVDRARRVTVGAIRELKEQSGKDIWLWGSLKLMHSLLHAGVVDGVRMLVCPVSRGKGTRIFEDRQDLKLLQASQFENGAAIRRYEIKK